MLPHPQKCNSQNEKNSKLKAPQIESEIENIGGTHFVIGNRTSQYMCKYTSILHSQMLGSEVLLLNLVLYQLAYLPVLYSNRAC
jgi:hypothetical protein